MTAKRIAKDGSKNAPTHPEATSGELGSSASAATPYDAMAHLIGSGYSGGMRLSQRTGEQFALLLQKKRQASPKGRLRSIRR
jgi:hypothetical protein